MKRAVCLLILIFISCLLFPTHISAQSSSTCKKEGNTCKTLTTCGSGTAADPDICESFSVSNCPFSVTCKATTNLPPAEGPAAKLTVPKTGKNGEILTVSVNIDETTWRARDPELRLFSPNGLVDIACYTLPVGSGTYTFQLPLESESVAVQIVEGAHRNTPLKSACDHPTPANIFETHTVTLSSPVTGNTSCDLRIGKNARDEETVFVTVNNVDCNLPTNMKFYGPTSGLDSERVFLGEKRGSCTNSVLTTSFFFQKVKEPTMRDGIYTVVKGDYTLEVLNTTTNQQLTSCTTNYSQGPDMVGEFGQALPVLSVCSSLSSESDEFGRCIQCSGGTYDANGNGTINDNEVYEQHGAFTALGCIPTDLPTFLKEYLFTIGLGFAGGIAFLLMLWGGFTILISQGDSHKIQLGREIIVSAGVGLLFIIFAIVILQIIGKDIIGIPGFGGESN